MYQIGDCISIDHEVHMLVQVSPKKVCACCLHDGNRWEEPVAVSTVRNISREEMQQICGGGTWHRANVTITVEE